MNEHTGVAVAALSAVAAILGILFLVTSCVVENGKIEEGMMAKCAEAGGSWIGGPRPACISARP